VEAGGIVLRAKLSMLSVTCTYADYQKITPYLSAEQLRIDDTAFGADVTVCVAMPVENRDAFLASMTEVTNGRAVLEEKGERFDYL
jgi:putative IMPACT (imprinted ancient) family translation regulator